MVLTSTSTAAPATVLKTPFLRARRALANAASVAARPAPHRALVVATAAAKKSWIPAFKSDAEFINPPISTHAQAPRRLRLRLAGPGQGPGVPQVVPRGVFFKLINGRWAMVVVLGIFVGQAWNGIPWFEAGADPGAIAPFSFASLLGTQLLLMGWAVEWATPWSRTAENFANFTGEQGYPGGKFFDPLGLTGTIKDTVLERDGPSRRTQASLGPTRQW
ncbi:hypothetical protein C2845_PM07G02120 [Panicum miliaceum]|uniref:Uncharacterized protein n=1 Tax=Panicum miliaceum TaxID=4540 RepID=A0A3L6SHV6_PANMI|nr:hypothetical protein C2845_PM07G02120 [Panicum miliaceum]